MNTVHYTNPWTEKNTAKLTLTGQGWLQDCLFTK